MASYRYLDPTSFPPAATSMEIEDTLGVRIARMNNIKIEAWPAAGGGLLLAMAMKFFAPRPTSEQNDHPSLFLVCDSENSLKLIAPYVKLQRDASVDIGALMERRLMVQKGSLSVVDATSQSGRREPQISIAGRFTEGGWLDFQLAEIATIFHKLLTLAAARCWSVPPETCVAVAGYVRHSNTGLKAPFAQFYRLAPYEVDRHARASSRT